MIRDPKDIQEQYRSYMYIGLIGLSVFGLILVATVNYITQNIEIAIFETGVIVFLLSTIFIAKKKKYLEYISNIATFLTAYLFLYILIQGNHSDPAPYLGLLGLLSVNAFLTVHRYSFVAFASMSLLSIVLAVFGKYISVSMIFFTKFLIVYILLFFIIYTYKIYMYKQVKELYKVADSAYTQGVAAGRRADKSEAAVQAAKKQQILLEQKNKELEAQKRELEEMNTLMTGREIRMAELKEKIAQLEQGYS